MYNKTSLQNLKNNSNIRRTTVGNGVIVWGKECILFGKKFFGFYVCIPLLKLVEDFFFFSLYRKINKLWNLSLVSKQWGLLEWKFLFCCWLALLETLINVITSCIAVTLKQWISFNELNSYGKLILHLGTGAKGWDWTDEGYKNLTGVGC